jgi:hypothetical protein
MNTILDNYVNSVLIQEIIQFTWTAQLDTMDDPLMWSGPISHSESCNFNIIKLCLFVNGNEAK